MNIKSLQLKKLLKDNEGDSYLDLSAPSMKKFVDTKKEAIYVVDAETEMRVDLISLKYYGTYEYIDIICKANNIFNPFSIQAGDVLVIPSITEPDKIYESPADPENVDLRGQFKDVSRISKKDQQRIKRLKEKAQGKVGAVSDSIPTNMLQNNETGIEKREDKIFLGTNLDSQPGSIKPR